MKKPRECFICGCTEDKPCITDEGPCSWAFETRAGPVCSACREKYPNYNMVIEKVCINCASIIQDRIGGKDSYTCGKGRFDTDIDGTIGAHHWFAWSGIKRPNKTVARARRSCTEWELHSRWQPKDGV